jgi:hypothetical protein
LRIALAGNTQRRRTARQTSDSSGPELSARIHFNATEPRARRSALADRPDARANGTRFLDKLDLYGSEPLSFLLRYDAPWRTFSRDEGFVCYLESRRAAVVWTDPLCAESELPALLGAFGRAMRGPAPLRLPAGDLRADGANGNRARLLGAEDRRGALVRPGRLAHTSRQPRQEVPLGG